MKRENKGIRPQDILLLAKLITLGASQMRQIDLAMELDISQAEVANSLERLKRAGLIDETKKRVNRLAAFEFFKHALKFLFPIEYEAPSRGILIGPSADFVKKAAKGKSDMVYIVEDLSGKDLGLAVKPIYHSVAKVIKKNDLMYRILCSIDILRGLGGIRHKQVAESELTKIILKGNKV